MILDATDLILGRIASFAAKKALLGENIDIINCENAIITGNKYQIFAKYKNKKRRGIPTKGPFFPKMPDMFVKRTIRGMLPYKKEKGEIALKRITCYIGVPDQFKDKKFETIAKANIANVPSLRYVKVENICKEFDAKW